jgi:two-component system copper resistance phosphate regulon response regulator CusR
MLHLYDYRKLLECFARIAPEVVMKILLVEDEVRTAHYLRKGLVESGFAVDVLGSETAGGGPRHTDYDLLVCDMAPDSARASKIRCDRQQSPVLFLVDRHEGAERPASPGDLLYKPFAFADFLARVRFLLNSRRNLGAMTLRIADLDLDLLRHRATRDCMRLDLTPKEFLLLSLLIRRSGEVLSKAFIADQVWEINFDSCTKFVDVHIRRLRSKVDDPFPKHLIHTVRGMGYVLEDRERRPQSILPRRTVTDAFGSVNEAFGLP